MATHSPSKYDGYATDSISVAHCLKRSRWWFKYPNLTMSTLSSKKNSSTHYRLQKRIREVNDSRSTSEQEAKRREGFPAWQAPRAGRCLSEDTYVWTDQGLQTIEEIFARGGESLTISDKKTDVTDEDLAVVNENQALESIQTLTSNNRRKVWEVTLSSGRSITATANHPIRVIDENGFMVWRYVKNIEAGDHAVSALFGAEEGRNGSSSLTCDEAELLGYLVADGALHHRDKICYAKTYDDARRRYIQLAEHVFDEEVVVYNQKGCYIYSRSARQKLAQKYGLGYGDAADKSVPEIVRTASPEVQKKFLAGYFDGDGHFGENGQIILVSASERLAREVQLMLYGFGIPCTNKPSEVDGYDHTYRRVHIPIEGANRFIDEIGVLSNRRRKQIKDRPTGTKPVAAKAVPNLASLIESLRDSVGKGEGFSSVAGGFIGKNARACSPQKLRKIIRWCMDRPRSASTAPILYYLYRLAQGDYTFEKVESVEQIGKPPTFDIVVPETHSFLANGVLSHNTTVTG